MKAISLDAIGCPDSYPVVCSLSHQNYLHNVCILSLYDSSHPFLQLKYHQHAGNSWICISTHLSLLHPRLISVHSVSPFQCLICISALTCQDWILFYWCIIALQSCISFCFITKWISYTYIYIPISLPSCISLPPTHPIPHL